MKKDIQQLLQECLEGYDAGLTPEECLSAYPHARAELEPLLRQALSLRVAYAAAPRPEFRMRAREKLLFAAGRDVKAAFDAEPDEQFVQTTRQRLLNTAGASMQEALRDVPPPRLPFWANARRRLLETASASPPRPTHAVAGVRSALSAAVIVIAVAVAGAAFFLQNSPANQPPRSAALVELEYISDQVAEIEQLRANGQPISTTLLDDLAERTSQLAAQYAASGQNSELLDKLPDLIQRQLDLASSTPLDESVAAAQERLQEADEQVTSAVAADPEASSTPDNSAAEEPTAVPSESPTAEPTPTTTVEVPEVAMVQPEDLGPNSIAIQVDPDRNDLGMNWLVVTTSTATFVMPETWEITNVTVDEDGRAFLPVPLLVIDTGTGVPLYVDMEQGEVLTVVDGQTVTLRAEGEDGTVVTPQELVDLLGDNDSAATVFTMLRSFELVTGDTDDSEPDEATPTPSVTPTP